MKVANLALRFLVELAALAAFAYWGANATANTAADVFLAIAVPVAVATAWGLWSAPRAARRLSGRRLLAFELTILAGACGLLAVAGAPVYAALLAVVGLANGFALRGVGAADIGISGRPGPSA